EAVALEAKFTNLASVAEVQSMAKYLSEDPGRKLVKIGEIKRDLVEVRFAEPDRGPVNLKELTLTLQILRGYLGLAAEEVEKEGEAALLGNLRSLRNAIGAFIQRISATDQSQAAVKLAAFQQALMDDIRGTFDALRHQDNRAGLRAEDLPEPLRNRFIGRTGKYLLQVYPREDVWQRPQQERFVKEVRSVAPEATGTPVQLLEYTTLLKNSYQEAAIYSLIAIIILVFIHFRSVTCVVLALMPVGIGMLWMLGFMAWKNVPFNPANIMTLPLVIGIGVTNGIHILNRFAEEQHPSIFAKSTGKAVLISALTTVTGFGSLILAEHQGIQSLGYVMAVGTATCMIAGLTFLPALLNLLSRRGWSPNKKPSGDDAQSTLGPEEPRY
ncbi:MAG TPA: MMPL family transporter, partial [Verrucomicrobiae bacterium]